MDTTNRASERNHIPNPDSQAQSMSANEDAAENHESKSSQPEYETPFAKVLIVLGSLTLASVLIFLDSSIISTAIPSITDEFHSLKDVGWYGSAYQLGSAALVPLTGSIYLHLPLKWSYLVFFALFEAGSALCGAAPSSAALIAGRVIAGIGGSGVNSGAFTILSALVPNEKRPALLGVLFGIAQLGAVLGPLIGGAFTANISWRWCFYINLPLGALVAVPLIITHIPDQIAKKDAMLVFRKPHHYLDLVGFTLFTGGIVQLLLALEFGGNEFSWSSSQIIGLFVGAGVTVIIWGFWNHHKAEDALIPFHIITRPVVFWSGINFAFLLASVYCSLYFLPIYFQTVQGAGPILSGVYLLAIILPQLVAAIASGKLVSIVGLVPPFALIGGALNTVGMGLYSLLKPQTTVGYWIGFSIICGFGRGIGLNSPLIATQVAVTPAEIAPANAFIVWCQYIGPTIFLTLFNVVFNTSLRSQLHAQAPDIDAEAVMAAGATGFRQIVSAQDIPKVVLAYATALDYTFYLGAGVGVLSFAAAWGLGWKHLPKREVVQAPAPLVEHGADNNTDIERSDREKT
ncbi:MFS general substrate transporter [Xylariaceae sp. AK1471]|nr:MFS general substrate transporter [Xylariaceae sp. AK1471]